MDLATTPEQRQLTETVRDLLGDLAHPEELRRLIEHGRCPDRTTWKLAAAKIDLAGLLVQERAGGAGLGPADLVIVLEELGRTPSALPMLASGVLAVTALAGLPSQPAADAELAAIVSGDHLATVVLPANGSIYAGPSGTVRGEACHVLDGAAADRLLVVAEAPDGPVLALVDGGGAGLTREPEPTLDPTRPMATIRFDRTPAVLLDGRPDVAAIADVGALAVAAGQVGGAQRCLELILEHTTVRQQFGRPIAAFQAVKHLCADLLAAIEPARAAVRLAAAAGASPEFPVLVAVAKDHAGRTYADAAAACIQLHGGIGYTWEHDAHLHHKRAATDALLLGDGVRHRARVADALVAGRLPGDGPAQDHPELRAEVRSFVAAHAASGVPAHGAHPPHDHRRTEADERWIALLREHRWLCLSWPERYGGRGLGIAEVIAVNEEFARAGLERPVIGMGESLLAPALLAHGTEEQCARILPRILDGTDVWCQGFSEPEAGSDLASLRTTGVVDGDELVVFGHKIWTSGGDRANRMFLLCRTDPAAEQHRGLSYVLLPMQDNGIEVRPIRQGNGGDGYCEEFIDGARASLHDVVGGLGQGWKVAMTTLGAERAGSVTTQHLGYARELAALTARLDRRGRLADPLVRDELGALAVRVQLMRAAGRRVADELRAGNPIDALVAIDKLNWSEYHRDFGEAAIRLQGLDGLVRPEGDGYRLHELQRAFLESPGRRIARGTNQIQRTIIAERVLGMPR